MDGQDTQDGQFKLYAYRDRKKVDKACRVMLYGRGGTGKTRHATNLPEEFGNIIYVAWDLGSEELPSTLHKNQDRMYIAHPLMEFEDQKTKKTKKSDLMAIAFDFAARDWKKATGDDNVKTIVWDTTTETARDFLQLIANKSQFSDKHIKVGSDAEGEHMVGQGALPMEGDFGGAQNRMDALIKHLIRCQTGMNIIVTAWEAYREPKSKSGEVRGGPTTVGTAHVTTFGGPFDTLLHLTATTPRVLPGQKLPEGGLKTEYRAYFKPHGIWDAKVRVGEKAHDVPVYMDLDLDPRKLWTKLKELSE